MKINKFITLAITLLAIVYLLVWQIKPFEYRETSKFIPETALLYVEQKNVEGFLNDLEKSKLGRAIQSIDFLKIGKKIELEGKEFALLKKINDAIENYWDNEIIKELFGGKVTLALLQPMDPTVYPGLTNFLKENIVLITKPKHTAEILQIIVERYSAYKNNISISTHQYGVHHIKRITVDDEILSTVVINGLYLVSFEERQLRRCIDTFDNESPSLSENSEFSSLKKNYSNPDQFLFLSLKNSREFIAKSLLTYEFPGKDILLKEIEAAVGFAGFSYGAWKSQHLLEDKIILSHNDKIGNSFIEKQLNILPSTCDTLRFSPKDPLVFYWTNVMDFAALYQYYNEKVAESDNKLTELYKTLDTQTGETLAQLFLQLGREFSYIITSNKESNFLSIPYGIVLFKIEHREKFEAELNKLISSYNFPFKKQQHGSTLFYSWTGSPQDGLEPLYGFVGDYLFMGNSSSLAKLVIDSTINGNNVQNGPLFLEFDPNLKEANNYISYTNNVELLNIVKSILNLASTVIAIEDKAAAEKISILTEDVVNPILDGLTMFDQTTTRSYFTADSIIIDSKTRLVD